MKYISLGQNCQTVVNFVNSNIMQTKKEGRKTCVFDLIISSYKGICDCIENDFSDFFNDVEIIDNFNYENTPFFFSFAFNKPYDNKLIVNKKYGYWFNHESYGHPHLYTIESWPSRDHFIKNDLKEFKIRFKNRINNFLNLLKECVENNEEVAFVMSTNITPTKLSKIIKNKYPTLKFKIYCEKLDD